MTHVSMNKHSTLDNMMYFLWFVFLLLLGSVVSFELPHTVMNVHIHLSTQHRRRSSHRSPCALCTLYILAKMELGMELKPLCSVLTCNMNFQTLCTKMLKELCGTATVKYRVTHPRRTHTAASLITGCTCAPSSQATQGM